MADVLSLGDFRKKGVLNQALHRAIDDARTGYDLFRILKLITGDMGFSQFVALKPIGRELDNLESQIIITNLAADFVREFDSKNGIHVTPIVAKLFLSNMAFSWDIALLRSQTSPNFSTEVYGVFEQYGFQSGIVFPLFDLYGKRGAVAFFGDAKNSSLSGSDQWFPIISHLYERLTVISPSEIISEKSALSQREKDCLRLTAQGKTSLEVAIILGIAESTVNHYISTSVLKLNAVNKTHAVVKAIQKNCL